MWTLTGFADEIAHDLGEQIELLNKLGIKHVELRSAWGTKVLELTDDQLAQAKVMFDEAGITLSAVGSPIGKIFITDDFGPHLEAMKRALHVAAFFGVRAIRMFSFFIPEGADPDQYRDEVIARMQVLTDMAAAADVVLLHENEKDIFGDIPRRVADLITTINSPYLRAIFDPANYVQCGVKPFDEAYPLVREFTDYIHIKDALFANHQVVLAGEGDGQVRELLAALKSSGYDGFFSLEPHLGAFDAFGGLCGPELWTTAHTALVGLFGDLGVEYV